MMNNNEDLVKVGLNLKQAREDRGLSVAQVAIDLNLLDAYINGLESADYSSIKSDVFVRGYIRTYGNYLKLDVNVLVGQYDAKAKAEAVVEEQDDDSSANAIYVLMAIIIVGLLVWALWPSSDLEIVNDESNSDQQVAVESAVVLTKFEPALETDITAPELQPTSITIDTPISDNGISTNAAGNELLLRFVEECWVEVRDNAGRLLLADLKNAGDEVTLLGEPPYKAVIGNAAAIEVFYAGKAIEIVGRGESNTAKLVIGG
jgi:cytoskeleton protein RodZ